MIKNVKAFVHKETVLCISAMIAAATMFIVPPDAEYIGYIDFRVLCLLMCLMAVVAGFRSVGAFKWLTCRLLSRIHDGRVLGIALVLLPFFCSMAVTNDVALIIFIPFTFALLSQLGCEKSVIPIIVLQTVAANLGSMATPVGNPQNLYLYSAYDLSAAEFFSAMVPLTAVSMVGLTFAALPVLPHTLSVTEAENASINSRTLFTVYLLLFILCLLAVFRIVNYITATAVVTVFLLMKDRQKFKEIDFYLLLTFICFFIISENLGRIDSVNIFLKSLLARNTLLTSIAASQIISNVPAAVLLSGFTDRWQALLMGVNIGGLGTPIASLASLITLKFYANRPNANIFKFLGAFAAANIIGLAILTVIALML